ncbi:hypothetical protein ING2E5A_2120 [Petrimonas mucosa]|uniref:Uncharacterized protein n=1 Tax=Petrimonas mucosa TaxID=1642646 RepID=A0A1G4G8S5_9BACT|nr:hypothetical protein ING2E5A_2120 [Petrimonas mucosa]
MASQDLANPRLVVFSNSLFGSFDQCVNSSSGGSSKAVSDSLFSGSDTVKSSYFSKAVSSSFFSGSLFVGARSKSKGSN